MRRDVVITGLGAVTPFGVGVDALWEALLDGRCAITRTRAYDPSGFDCQVSAEVEDFKPRDHVPKHYRKAVKVMARDSALAVAAALDAVRHAGLTTRATDPEGEATYAPNRLGCHIGAGLIACEVPELTLAMASARGDDGGCDLAAWGESGMYNLTPLWLLKYLPNMLSCHVTILHDAQGPSNTITCSEASGLLSIGESMRVIERGDADVCFSGGAESKVNLMGQMRLQLADRLAEIEAAGEAFDGSCVVRPYDDEAPGSVLGEGGGILIVEDAEAARARGARVYARVAGFGAGQAPSRGTPEERSVGLRLAIEAALRDAGCGPGDIDAIVPHACGQREMDAEERAALEGVFAGRLGEIETITLTPTIGDLMAGSGGVAACAAALCLHHQTIPARVHAGTPNGVNAGARHAGDAPVRRVLACTHALGGQAAAVVFERGSAEG